VTQELELRSARDPMLMPTGQDQLWVVRLPMDRDQLQTLCLDQLLRVDPLPPMHQNLTYLQNL
jgi:hypothetical protein